MKDNYEKYLRLRAEHPLFIFEGYDYELTDCALNITYRFSLPDTASFAPSWSISRVRTCEIDPQKLDTLVFCLGMVELVSYYKCACSPTVRVECGSLPASAAAFFDKLYRNGLGEFLYTNSIPVDAPLCEMFFSGDEKKPVCPSPDEDKSRTLVPVGGGKDSAVTLELLRGRTDEYPFIINPRGATVNTVERAGYTDRQIIARRTIDPELLRLNAEGYLNGHTPFSAIVAFSSVLAAYINGIGYVALSNESSANEATVAGTAVNHQYSKSFEFECDFREFEKRYIGCGVDYFSLLRPWTELHIASVFSRLENYHDIFRSCNAGSKADEWCGHCPKCLFVAIILAPFMSRDKLSRIFGRDILDDPELRDTFEKLIGIQPEKPFECVGSRGEVNAALRAACERWGDLPYLLRYYRDELPHTDDRIEDYLGEFSDNNVPAQFGACVYASCFRSQLASRIAGKRVLILGYGREGRSSYALLSSLCTAECIDIADMKEPADRPAQAGLHCGTDYLDCIDDYDIVMKTPGVVLPRAREEYNACITSQVELFIGFYRDNIIGVTGTKGKSTTSTLLYHTLRSAGVDCVIGGNIGTPVLDLIDGIRHGTRVVLELSCHQLEYCSVSPATSILLNFFEDHLDHYGTFEKYVDAKRNIYRHARAGDLLICGVQAEDAVCEREDIDIGILPFKTFDEVGAGLRGEHNLYNCAAVLAAARRCGVSDESFVRSLPLYSPLPHRLEYFGKIGGVDWYDDSISTTAQSAMSAVAAVPNAATLLLGGMDRGIDYTELVQFIRDGRIERVILMYESGRRIAEQLGAGARAEVYVTDDLEHAVEKAKEITPAGGACILSPAAASYGYFKNFEDRGRKFKEYVKR